MSDRVLLEMKGVHKKFPGVYALNNVSLNLRAGEVHALLGENGAGKSTLIKVLGGIYKADAGEIYIEGKKVEINSVFDSHAAGVAIIHQELVLVPHMTVAENIYLGREPMKGKFIDKAKMNDDARALLKAYSMAFTPETEIADLTIAQQQMVEIVKAISFNSKILVMDEPTSSISDREVDFLFKTMRYLTKEKNVGIIYISHKMSELWEICDRVTVLRDGQYVATNVVKETKRDDLIAQMVGRTLTAYYTRDFLPPGEVVLKAEHVSSGKMVKDVSFELRKGEILGFAGLVGAGRSETMEAIFGLTGEYGGKVTLNGREWKIKSAVEAVESGMALVPEDRKLDGLYKVMSVRYNSTIEVLKEFIKGVLLDHGKEEKIATECVTMMRAKTPTLDTPIGNLSGGNQQKVLISRWLATKPEILILDEPTRGVDVGAKAEIYTIMNDLVKKGLSIIMISSELPEIINMSDRVVVMAEGKVTGCLDRKDVTQEKIMSLAAIE